MFRHAPTTEKLREGIVRSRLERFSVGADGLTVYHSGLEFEFGILAPFLPSDGHKNFKVPITPSGLFLEQVRQSEAAPKNLAKPSPYPVQTLWRLP